ncbi:MAG TPA: DUF3467 domain-containing protein [Terracidiphilus sp.]|jgi:hypothetical protein|nr:DUF3467 domain-containing protein [Terracidiphilus sp.]
MEQEKKKPQELKHFEWKSVPGVPEIYSNYLYIGWTLDDVRVTFGGIKSVNVNSDSHIAEEKGSVVLSWRQAKNLRDMLSLVVDAFESKNGEITPPYLADPASGEIGKEQKPR